MSVPGPQAGEGGSTYVSRRSAFGQPEESRDYEEVYKAALEDMRSAQKPRRMALRPDEGGKGNESGRLIDVKHMGPKTQRALVGRAMKDDDDEEFLHRIRRRMDRAGIEFVTVEVKFENLTVDAKVHVGKRALPSVINAYLNAIENLIQKMGIKMVEKRELHILKNISGVIKPGKMTLLLGPPGSGKSLLLRSLAGKLKPGELEIGGEVTYNGHTLDEFVPERTAAYIEQTDNHTPELTVRETLDFAAQFQGVGHKADNLRQLLEREQEQGIEPDPEVDAIMKGTASGTAQHNIITEYILNVLGLTYAADTQVGNAMIRGISGGQRKRVTTGEMIVGPKKTLFMDEISTGLDSSTTFSIVRSVRNFAHLREGTVLISLLQPAPETYDLFDDVLLLAEGQIVFHGPRDTVLPFFESFGFKLPERKGVADFLQEVTSVKDQKQYWASDKPYNFIPVPEFVEAFKASKEGRLRHDEVQMPFDRNMSTEGALLKEKYGNSQWHILKASFSRELLLVKRQSFIYKFRTTQVLLASFLAAFTWFRVYRHSNTVFDGQIYNGLIFFTLVHLMFNGLSEVSITIERLPVFYKQRDNRFFPAWTFGAPGAILRLPYSLLEASIFSCFVYWIAGLAPEASRFFAFWFIAFLMHSLSVSLFRMIGVIGRTQVIGSTLGSFVILLTFLSGGFVLSKESTHPWTVWVYWITPLSYAQNALSINEFNGKRWQTPYEYDPSVTVGHQVLRNQGLYTETWRQWVYVAVLIAYIILLNIALNILLYVLGPLKGGQATVLDDETDKNKTGSINRASRRAIEAVTTGHNGAVRLDIRGSSNSSSDADADATTRNPQLEPSDDGSKLQAGMVLPFEPLSMAFTHLWYSVDLPPGAEPDTEVTKKGGKPRLYLLKDVNGYFRPGVLTALVGESGAGKTTLMDVLAGRKTGGEIDGNITIQGHPKEQASFARVSGYVEQQDIHAPALVVRESLQFSAHLRLPPDTSSETIEDFVDQVMELVELTPLRNTLVGAPGVSGLSVEQRKRLTIAVELVSNPSIIFMDEPTSGLDARAAAIVMRAVRNTVDTGRTVVCTIHQPSIDIFESFDELLLMKRGGRVIYFGSLGKESVDLVDYMEAIEGVPDIEEDINPATYVLQVTNRGAENRLGRDFADIFAESGLARSNLDMAVKLSVPEEGSSPLHFKGTYASGFGGQLRWLLWKNWHVYWRSPSYNSVRLGFTIIIALCFGAFYWNVGHTYGTVNDIFNIVGALYAATLFLGVTNATSVQPVLSVERTVFYRERAAGMYSVYPFALATGLIEIPYIIFQTVTYCAIVYSMVQFSWTAPKFFWFLLFTFLTQMYFTMYGIMAIALTPALQVAAVASSTFYTVWNLFAGFLIPFNEIPWYFRWYCYIDPVYHTIYALVASQLGDITDHYVTLDDGSKQTVKQFVRDYFGYKHSRVGWEVLILVGFVAVFWLTAAVALAKLNFQRR